MTASFPIGLSLSGILRDFGYVGLAALMVVENVFPPIPSEAILPLAGYLASNGELSLVAVLVASTAGSVAGSALLYELARHGGRPFATRFLRFARLDADKLDEAEEWFERRGSLVVLFGRCVPGVRSLVSLPAGVLRMPRGRYIALTIAGSAVWNSVLVGAGWLLGHEWERVSNVVGALSTPLLVVVFTAAAGILLWRGLRHRVRR